MFEPFKYLLQPVAIERDETTGRVVRELPGEILTVYNPAELAAAAAGFEAELAALQPIEEVT